MLGIGRIGFQLLPPPRPTPLTDLNKYIDYFKADGMTEGEMYEVMDENVSDLKVKCRKLASKGLWAHSGHEGNTTLTVQPMDNHCMRCLLEVKSTRMKLTATSKTFVRRSPKNSAECRVVLASFHALIRRITCSTTVNTGRNTGRLKTAHAAHVVQCRRPLVADTKR